MARSRDIPAAFHFVVDLIVRKVSSNSLLRSLQQTEQAVRGHSTVAMKPAAISTGAEQIGALTSLFSNKSSEYTDIR